MILNCPICESPVELDDDTRISERLTCPTCSAQLALHMHKQEKFLTCPTCKEPIFDPQNCEDCDRRKEKKRLLKEGRL